MKDHFEHFLTGNPKDANALLDHVLERAEERLRRRKDREFARKTPTRKVRLPGKLADCAAGSAEGTEIFLVEGIPPAVLRNRPATAKSGNTSSPRQDPKRCERNRRQDARQPGNYGFDPTLGCGYGDTYDPSKRVTSAS